MKINAKFFLLGLLSLLACEPGEPGQSPQPEPQVPEKGVPTEVGKPVGEPITKVIGPAGGTISTPGNILTLVIPAGALKKDTTVTIQPIENKAIGGAGLGYEMTPKNLELAKPAEVIWNYTDQEISGSTPEALGIAFQQPDRTWLGRRNVTVDQPRKRVSTPITKLLPAAFYEQYTLLPAAGNFVPGEHAEFYVHFQKGARDKDMLSSLVDFEVLRNTDVRNWRVNGQDLENRVDPKLGTLAPSGSKASASYIAPSRVTGEGGISVSVEVILENKSKLILVGNFTIKAANAFSFSGAKVDSAEVGTIAVVDGQLLQISLAERQLTGDAQAMVILTMQPFPGVGVYHVSGDRKVSINAMDSRRKHWSDSYYNRPTNTTIIGPLEVYISSYDKAKKKVAGTISGTMHFYDEKTEKHETTSLTARFQAASPY